MTTTTTPTKTTWLHKCVKHPEFLAPLELPKRYAQAVLSDIPVESLTKCARRYGADFWDVAPNGIAPLFVGSGGKWKTATAAAIARAIHTGLRIDVAWCNCAAEFVQFDRNTFSPETKIRLRQLETVPFLVLDDFTQVAAGTRMMNTLVEIGSIRYDNLLPTLWTGNITLTAKYDQKLVDAVGVCLARRIFDGSDGYRVMVK